MSENDAADALVRPARLDTLLPPGISLIGDGSVPIAGLTADSREVRPGFVFAALKGSRSDGVAFVEAALSAGAAAILTDTPEPQTTAALKAANRIITDNPRKTLAEMAARFYPAQPATIAAVTGTAGKTSVAAFLREMWLGSGKVAASIGTVGVVSPTGSVYGSLTTPDPVHLHETIDRLARQGVTHLALEASSHGLDQYRLDGVRIGIGGFTNLGRDHMDYHPTIEAYFHAKMQLFERLLPRNAPFAVDLDSAYGQEALARGRAAGCAPLTVGSKGEAIRLVSLARDGFRQRLTLDFGHGPVEVLLPLVGRFQVSNALVAGAMALASGLSADVICTSFETLKGEAGRLEYVGTTRAGALVFIDYAHKVEALDNVLDALRPYAARHLIAVFGAGGDRDRGKRALMGKVAAEKADRVIVTDDNPRSEEPATIRAMIMEAVPAGEEIGDRERAIFHALRSATKGDVVVIAGKGHETGQIIGEVTLPFSDHEVVRRAINAGPESG